MSEKKPNGIQLLIRAVVKDADGKVLSDTGQKPSKSFVIQFLEFFYGLFRGTGVDATDINNAENDIYSNKGSYDRLTFQFRMDAGVNIGTHGQVVGTGEAAESNTDYKLATRLTEGVGAGNITHGEQVIETVAVVGANVDMECKRSFPNNTGSTITIKEVGAYTKWHYNYPTAEGPYYHCIIRDLLDTPIDVPDKCALTVYYTLRTTV